MAAMWAASASAGSQFAAAVSAPPRSSRPLQPTPTPAPRGAYAVSLVSAVISLGAFVGASRERSARTPTVSRQVLVPQLKDWRKPFKPRIKPERPDHKRFPDDEPMKSRPQFAKFALMAKELCWVTSKQLEDARREIVRATSRTAKVYLRVYPHNAITQRIADSRTGASKGRFEYWVAALKPGVVIFELDVESEELARRALKAGSRKLPFKVSFKFREEGPAMFELTA
ncbi:rpl16 [Symbiodinium sp. CCMP2592]|nr:rpl16 [Symbiodinium sp. CCMP2592]